MVRPTLRAMLREIELSIEARTDEGAVESTTIHAIQIDVLAAYYVACGHGDDWSFDEAIRNINDILGE